MEEKCFVRRWALTRKIIDGNEGTAEWIRLSDGAYPANFSPPWHRLINTYYVLHNNSQSLLSTLSFSFLV